MKRVSVEEAFGWTQRFASREWRLVLPVALAFAALPLILSDVAVPAERWKVLQAAAALGPAALLQAAGWLMPLSLLVLLLGLLGGLAITALGLIPRISVQEAIGLALRRLGTFLLALVALFAATIALATLAAVIMGVARLTPYSMQSALVGVILGATLYLSTRLLPLGPVILERRIGPLAAIRLSWELTQGAFWRLLGAVLIYLVGGAVLLALGMATSAALLVFANLMGSAEAGTVLSAVVLRSVAAIVSAGLHLLVVGLYRQLAVTMRGI